MPGAPDLDFVAAIAKTAAETSPKLASVQGQVQATRSGLTTAFDPGPAARLITDAGNYDVLPNASAPAANGRDVIQLGAGKRAVWNKRKVYEVNLTEFAGLTPNNNTDISEALTDALRLLRLDGAGPVGRIFMPRQTTPGNPPQAYIGQAVDLDLSAANTAESYRVDLDLGNIRMGPNASITVRNGWRTRINAYLTGGQADSQGLILRGLQYPVVSVESVGYLGTTLVLPGSRANGDQCNLVNIERLITQNGGQSLIYGPESGYCDAQGLIGKISEIGMAKGTYFRNARDVSVQYHENHQGSDVESLTLTNCGAIHYGKVLLGDKGTLVSVGGTSTKVVFDEAYLTGGGANQARGVYVGGNVWGLVFQTLITEGLAVGIESANGAAWEAGYISEGNNTVDFRWSNGADNITLSAIKALHAVSFPAGPHFTRPSQQNWGAAPAYYTNNTARTQRVYISGGAVSLVEIGRLGVLFQAGVGAGSYELGPGDYLKATYTTAPTVWVQQL